MNIIVSHTVNDQQFTFEFVGKIHRGIILIPELFSFGVRM